jgi:hypothetical protein
MSPQLAQVMTGAEGRYLTSAEMDNVMNIMRGYETRMNVMKEIEAHEDYIIKTTIERVFEKYPQFQQERPNAYEKCVRDESLVLRYAALAYVNDNPEIFTEKVMFWMQTIVQSMGFGDVARFTYVTMQGYITEKLGAENAAGVNHYLQMMVDCLDD